MVLLAVIYIAFIGLGIPDSLFGPSWPAINLDFNVPISYASFVSVTVTICTTISSLFTVKLVKKIGTKRVVAYSTLLTAIALFGYSISSKLIFLMIFGVFLGFGAGAIDSTLNNYVALHYKATVMNFLHCFYGVGVTVSPFIMGYMIEHVSWRLGYRVAGGIQLLFTLLIFLSFPLWDKKEKEDKLEKIETEEENMKKEGSLFSHLSNPLILCSCFIFLSYVALEFTCGQWMSSYLVKQYSFDPSLGAYFGALFYGGLAFGRLVSGFAASKLSSKQLIKIGISFVFVSLVVLALTSNPYLAGGCLFLIGAGDGPIYPNFMHLTPKIFGKKESQAVISLEMAFCYCGGLVFPALFAILSGKLGLGIFPYYLLILCILLILNIIYYMHKTKKCVE